MLRSRLLRGLLTSASRYLHDWGRALAGDPAPALELFAPPGQRIYRTLERVVLTEEVGCTLFQDFADHRAGPRGEEEVGWVLLGVREEREALVLATLPAGADREAGVAHVHFNSTAQAVASRIVRQSDRRLGIVGVVHTHPGSLRHPSDGDFRGDSLWVGRLRGGEGVFGIGTADAKPPNGKPITHPEHVLSQGDLCFSWYALGEGDGRYRRLQVDVASGPDLARSLHPVWEAIETHASDLDRLCRQLAQVKFEIIEQERTLVAQIAVWDSDTRLRIVMRQGKAKLFLHRGSEVMAIDPDEPQLDRAVFLVLAELARQHASDWNDAERTVSERKGPTGSRPMAVV